MWKIKKAFAYLYPSEREWVDACPFEFRSKESAKEFYQVNYKQLGLNDSRFIIDYCFEIKEQ